MMAFLNAAVAAISWFYNVLGWALAASMAVVVVVCGARGVRDILKPVRRAGHANPQKKV